MVHKTGKLSNLFSLLILLLFVFLSAAHAEGKKYKAAIAQMPVISESPTKGVLVFLVKAWDDAVDDQIEIGVFPFKRALSNALSGEADFEFPFIKNPKLKTVPAEYDYSTTPVYNVNFVLYYNKNKKIDRSAIDKFIITTDAAHVELFDFKIGAEFDVEAALKKLEVGKIDGFIHADVACDPILKNLGLKNVGRELFDVFPVHAILAKGKQGSDVDKMLTEAVKRVKASGKHAELMDPIYKSYDNWQP
jgi:polar amino acid transport system substrate-binding protein